MSIVFAHPGIAMITLGLMAIPLIIHLLTRRRYRNEPWAAMAFLLAAQRRSRRRMRIEQWLLLAVRTLVVGALGFAIARPALSSSALARAVGEPRFDRVLILDDTLSMQAQRRDSTTAFEAARELAQRLIDSFDSRDRVAVVTMARPARAIIEQPTIDRALTHRVVGELKPSAGTADLAGALALARQALSQGDAPGDCQALYVLTDVGRSTWRRERGSFAGDDADLASSTFAALAGRERRFIVNTGAAARGNLAISDLRPQTRWVAPGSAVTFEVDVRNWGVAAPREIAVEVSVDGAAPDRYPIDPLPAGASRRVECRVHLSRAGSHVVSAKLVPAQDVLPADDERAFALDVADEIPILLVSGGRPASATSDACFYLELALAPSRIDPNSSGQPRLFAPQVFPAADLPSQDLAKFRAVVLANVPRLATDEWSRLAEFVRDGGGLLISLGDRVDLDAWNAAAGPDAKDAPAAGLLPAALAQAVSASEDRAVRLRVEDWTHPVTADLSGHVGGGLLSTPIREYVQVSRGGGAEPADAARPIISYENGDAALLEKRVGRGQVVLWTGSMQMDWSTLPAKPDFVPLIINTVAYVANNDSSVRNVRVGEPLVMPVPPGASDRAWTIRRADGREESPTISRQPTGAGGQRWLLRYERTDAAGRYAADDERTHHWFAATTDPAESDLSALTEYELRQRLSAPFVYVDAAEDILRRKVVPPRNEIAGAITGLLFALVLCETLLAAWFGHHQ